MTNLTPGIFPPQGLKFVEKVPIKSPNSPTSARCSPPWGNRGQVHNPPVKCQKIERKPHWVEHNGESFHEIAIK